MAMLPGMVTDEERESLKDSLDKWSDLFHPAWKFGRDERGHPVAERFSFETNDGDGRRVVYSGQLIRKGDRPGREVQWTITIQGTVESGAVPDVITRAAKHLEAVVYGAAIALSPAYQPPPGREND